MKIALPLTAENEFSAHYGGASRVAVFDVDLAPPRVRGHAVLTPPDAEPCGWADWLHAQGVQLVLAGGMGGRPRQRYAALGIDVLVGVPPAPPAQLVEDYLEGRLAPGENACGCGDHAAGHRGHPHHHSGHDGDCGCGH